MISDEQIIYSESSSALQIALHPLVIINISDHYTHHRLCTNGGLNGEKVKLFGAILGTQTGRTVEIFNSFEIVSSFINDNWVLDTNYLRDKLEQFSKIFPYELLGWYTTGLALEPVDVSFHKQLMQFCENPLLLLFNPYKTAITNEELPLFIFDTETHLVGEQVHLTFAKASYSLVSEQAERVSVDHIRHITSTGVSGASSSAAQQQLEGLESASSMLLERIQVIQRFLQAVHEKQIVPFPHALVRQAVGALYMLPSLSNSEFEEKSTKEMNSSLMITFLSTLTKDMNNLIELASAVDGVGETVSKPRGSRSRLGNMHPHHHNSGKSSRNMKMRSSHRITKG
eukprot:GCRY01001872.1.p1 GENE.GCRY01001872.1~~GCRY01001872.1.p1  ORF type:complete len:342 (-),score=28.13 GCRY01001872.1:52-1077(-)